MEKMDLVSISFYFSIWGCFCLLLVSDWIIQDFRLRPPNTSDWLELTLVRPIANKLYVYGQEEYHKKSLKMALSQKMLENFHVSKINRYSKSLSWAENLNFLPKSLNNLFKFSAQNSDLEYLFWRTKNPPVSSDLKSPLQ